jgi:predicted RNA-binding Zn-ribbon protein involved in translation (DUF1610 family)
MEHDTTDQEYACEDCGFTSPLSDDVCPNCGGKMTALDAPVKARTNSTDDSTDTHDDEALTSADADGGALSLERLQEEESRDDYQEDYGDSDA